MQSSLEIGVSDHGGDLLVKASFHIIADDRRIAEIIEAKDR